MSRIKQINNGVSEIDKVLHSPLRLNIVLILDELEYCDAVFLVNQLNISWGNLSTHLNVLVNEKYVSSEKKFIEKKPKTILSITQLGIERLQSYKQNMTNLIGDKNE
ncbi:hypothetical protein BK011_07870 [Tenericutes bacterium MZ-XQ]|nr:hypothetical protein BK011_07870 [Tenericutes bacterium MZ-XQ]